jgi:hypothetical protein
MTFSCQGSLVGRWHQERVKLPRWVRSHASYVCQRMVSLGNRITTDKTLDEKGNVQLSGWKGKRCDNLQMTDLERVGMVVKV